MSARTILNPATNTALEGLGSGQLVIDSPTYPGNAIAITTGDNIAGINFTATSSEGSASSSINYYSSSLQLSNTIETAGTGANIFLIAPLVNVQGHLSFGPGATPLRIFSGSVIMPALTANVPVVTNININTGGAWGGGTPFVNVPNVFVSLQQTSGYDSAVVSGFATNVSNSAFSAVVQSSTVAQAGVYKLIWYAIGN